MTQTKEVLILSHLTPKGEVKEKPGISALRPEEILHNGLKQADGPVALACSFSIEDVVLIDMLHRLQLPITVFALDTGRLNEETYEAAEAIREKYGIHIDWHFPKKEAVEQLEREKGLFSFRESLDNRHECCQIRKVEPLKRALHGLAGWVTGMRREQSVSRSDIRPIETDNANGGLLKINPLVDWSSEQVWQYADAHQVPVNSLHRQGYPSIGCAPCTRAVNAGEELRAGRWWWEDAEKKECGLHRR